MKRLHLMIDGPLNGQSVEFEGLVMQTALFVAPAAKWASWWPHQGGEFRAFTYFSHTIMLGSWTYKVASPLALPNETEQAAMIDILIAHETSHRFRDKVVNR